ncbi:MAG: phospholipid-binding lipoprotein MlaA [Candidatus Malihini olakiniferum]
MNNCLSGVVLASTMLFGCASYSDKTTQIRSDSLEEFNRTIFNFNYNVLDPFVVRPVAVAWRDYMPKPARNALINFFSNLEEPSAVLNYLLSGDPHRSMIHFNRFFLNTILGVGGLFDLASATNPTLIKEEPRRFGTTLGSYGVGYGSYMVLPGYGSATFREEGGGMFDTLYPVLSYLAFWASASKWVIEGVEARAQLLDSDSLLRNSLDPYLVMREIYFQRHDFLTLGSRLPSQENQNAAAIKDSLQEIDALDPVLERLER